MSGKIINNMKKYEGRIEHNSDTIRRLFKAAYDTYEIKKVMLRFLVGAALAILGLMGRFSLLVQGALLMVGCWLLVSRDFPSKCRADRALEARKQALPTIRSVFYDDRVELDGEGHMRVDYKNFQYLVEEKGYFFLFLGQDSACMIDEKTLKPDSREAFKTFLEEKTGLQWRETTSWLNMSLMDVIRLFRR